MRKAAAIARARRSAPWPKCSAAALPDGYRALARELIEAVLPTLADLRSLRAQAYVILAWGHLWAAGVEGHRTARERGLVRGAAAGGMLPPCAAAGLAVVRVAHDLCQRGACRTPCSSPRSAGRRRHSWKSAKTSFAFLDRETTAEDVFWPVGNSGWYPHGEDKAPYDQQPVEAVTMAEAALAAFGLLGDEQYLADLPPGPRLVPRPEQLETAPRRSSSAAPAVTVCNRPA